MSRVDVMNGDNLFSFSDVMSVFGSPLTRAYLFQLEDQGKIPMAQRVQKGKSYYRYWGLHDLPKIGSYIDKLPNTGKTEVITVYLSKGGGSSKTTFTWNFSRWLGLHGKKVLIIPLDQQLNLSFLNNVDNSFEAVSKGNEFHPGIANVLMDKYPIKQTIVETSLPTVHIIPESPMLIKLERYISMQDFKERLLTQAIEEIKDDYDVILFDTAPSWSSLITNAVIASKYLISPIGVDVMSYRTLPVFLQLIKEFSQSSKHTLDGIILIPGFVESTRLSQQVLGAYQATYPERFTESHIRRSTTIPEASNAGLSIFEYAGNSPAAEDYNKVCREVWNKICKKQEKASKQ